MLIAIIAIILPLSFCVVIKEEFNLEKYMA